MSYSPKKLSPLDDIRQKTSSCKGDEIKRSSDEYLNMFLGKEGNESVLSLDSLQTTERLLDRLDLSTEDEVLLQQALREEETRRTQLQDLKQKRVLCMPASGFPSLRHAGGSGNHSNLIDHNSTMHIINGLSNKEKVRPSNRNAIELHFSKYRYSYLVEEESDAEENDGLNPDQSVINQAVSIDKFRLKNYQYTSKMDTLTETYERQNYSFPAPNRPTLKTSQQSPFHTPKGSISSIESKYLIKPSTQSSGDSDLSKASDVRVPHYNSTYNFSTPRKSNSNSSIQQDISSPSKSVSTTKTHKKKSSFSLKNLFRSPKVESIKSPKKDYSTSLESTPVSKNFRFPSNQQDFYSQSSSPSPYTASDSHTPNQQEKHNQGHKPDNNYSLNISDDRASEITESCFKSSMGSISQRKLSLNREKSMESTSHTDSPKLQSGTAYSNYLNHEQDLVPERRIRTAIELRNRGHLKESTEQLRALCNGGYRIGYLLYGLALRHGSGTKQDYKSSFKYLKMAADIQSEELQIFDRAINPFELNDVPYDPPEPLAPALYECGICYLKGYGVEFIDEVKGLKYLEIAASLGHIDSMCLSGTIWSKKSRNRKKDSARAAAWFRLADKRGATLIGAEWIYKDKYMKPRKK